MPKEERKFVLGVDLDGVCADFYGALRPIAAEWSGKRANQLPKKVSWGLPEWGIKSDDDYQALHRFAVTQRNLYRDMKPIKGAAAALRLLDRNKKLRIRIITNRLYIKYTHQIAITHTVEWLDRYGIPYWDLCFMKEKAEVGADLYIDDSPSNIKSLLKDGNSVIVFTNSTNRNYAFGHPKPHRAKSWQEVVKHVQNAMPRQQ